MTKARRTRTLRVYVRLVRRDALRSLRQLAVVKHTQKGQVSITLTRPRFKTSQNYFKKWRQQLIGSAAQLRGAAISIGLLMVGMIGVGWGLIHLSQVQASSPTVTRIIKTQERAPSPTQPPSLARSLPTRVAIADIGVDTPLIQLGQNDDGTLAVPDSYDEAGWYTGSPTPGEIGPSIIVGHVDNYMGAAVFFRLKELQPGQRISVTREDGTVASFVVTQVAQFDQNNFPTDAVYGNIDHAGLRLITCGGPFDHVAHRYTQNTVVFASYTPAT